MKFRIGQGYDVHRLKAGEKLILGGIEIVHTKGTVAHSDGDVLIHAICDALLGAANLRDIGYHFSDTSPTYKNIDSRILLKKTMDLLLENRWKVGNIDSTIELQKPKIMDAIPEMKKRLSRTINISPDDICIKATTTERLGFVGREEGIAASAVVLIEKIDQ
jgi:2-C-methyl-D-erythritol 2,4-cyclodiphosphate synthase